MASVAEGASTCPKCGAPRGDRACPKCGLAVEKMETYADRREAEVPAVVRTSWDHVLEAWDADDRHVAFLRLVVDENAFAWAAAQYRGARGDAGKAARAETMLERVKRAAEVRLAASASARPEPKSPFTSVKILLGGAVIMILALLLMLTLLGKKSVDKRTLAPPASTDKVR